MLPSARMEARVRCIAVVLLARPFCFHFLFSTIFCYCLFFYLIMHYRYLPSSLTHTHNCLYLFPLGNHVSLLSLLSLLFLSLSPSLSLSSDLGSHTFSGGKFTCDSWWTHATNGKGPTCTDEKSPGFSHMTMKQVTNTMVSNGCCGPNGESFCEDQDVVDNGGTTNGSAGGRL